MPFIINIFSSFIIIFLNEGSNAVNVYISLALKNHLCYCSVLWCLPHLRKRRQVAMAHLSQTMPFLCAFEHETQAVLYDSLISIA